MENNSLKQVSEFKQIAEKRLSNHLAELNTRYSGEAPESRDLINTAFEDHRNILKQELEHTSEQIAGNENPWLKAELLDLANEYLERLTPAKERD